MYSQWDITVRELGGGVWFFTSFWLVVAFSSYIIRETAKDSRRDYALILAATSLVIYFVGSMIRGFLTWMQFLFAGHGWNTDQWVATWPWFGLSVALNIIGAEFCIYLLNRPKWRLWFSLIAGTTSLFIPIAVRLWL